MHVLFTPYPVMEVLFLSPYDRRNKVQRGEMTCLQSWSYGVKQCAWDLKRGTQVQESQRNRCSPVPASSNLCLCQAFSPIFWADLLSVKMEPNPTQIVKALLVVSRNTPKARSLPIPHGVWSCLAHRTLLILEAPLNSLTLIVKRKEKKPRCTFLIPLFLLSESSNTLDLSFLLFLILSWVP